MKSRVTARPAKREEMPDKRWQGSRRRESRGGRKRRRGAGIGEVHSARENFKIRRASIKPKAECAAGGERKAD